MRRLHNVFECSPRDSSTNLCGRLATMLNLILYFESIINKNYLRLLSSMLFISEQTNIDCYPFRQICLLPPERDFPYVFLSTAKTNHRDLTRFLACKRIKENCQIQHPPFGHEMLPVFDPPFGNGFGVGSVKWPKRWPLHAWTIILSIL